MRSDYQQKSRSEYRGGFPLLSTPFQDWRPSGHLILMFNLPFVKDCYAKSKQFFYIYRKASTFLLKHPAILQFLFKKNVKHCLKLFNVTKKAVIK